jgi:hypothetical protein
MENSLFLPGGIIFRLISCQGDIAHYANNHSFCAKQLRILVWVG